MTKRHFKLFAAKIKADVDAALQHCRPDMVEDAVTKARYAADMFASVAAEDNPRFDRGRFLAACGFR
jgi:hypothetical protein